MYLFYLTDKPNDLEYVNTYEDELVDKASSSFWSSYNTGITTCLHIQKNSISIIDINHQYLMLKEAELEQEKRKQEREEQRKEEQLQQYVDEIYKYLMSLENIDKNSDDFKTRVSTTFSGKESYPMKFDTNYCLLRDGEKIYIAGNHNSKKGYYNVCPINDNVAKEFLEDVEYTEATQEFTTKKGTVLYSVDKRNPSYYSKWNRFMDGTYLTRLKSL